MKIEKAELFLAAIIQARASGNVALERFLIERARKSTQRNAKLKQAIGARQHHQPAIRFGGRQITRPL